MNNPRKKAPCSPQDLCGEVGQDDCIDPRRFFDRRQAESGTGRKAKQLCRQVQRTLDMVLADGECSVLGTLQIEDVCPAGGSAQLLVIVRCDQPPETLSDEIILSKLLHSEGRLRSEVAASISRKRTPNLIFRVLPRSEMRRPACDSDDS